MRLPPEADIPLSRRRRFGYARRLPSSRWQASYLGPNGRRQSAPDTFATKGDAGRWLARVELDITDGTWVDDQLGLASFGDYARAWLDESSQIGPRWRETCERNLRLGLAPLEDVPMKAITPSVVRGWHTSAPRSDGGKTSIAQSYRFLRAVMNTAVRDGAIVKNPCNIPGAGSDHGTELGDRVDLGDGDEVVAAEPTDLSLDTALLVCTLAAGLTVEGLDAVVRAEGGPPVGLYPLAAEPDHTRDVGLEVVVADLPGRDPT